ncbi:hypothetical protein [Deinococcus aquatilis]|uniref:hypothetical protein n=1 Tax=Deinococcus aquatilis TaxID=519440 RepID=UPI000381E0F3|nr:hypothetical protein [Deinococcus aquatilis]
MKKLLVFSLLSFFASTAQAQRTIPCNANALVTYASKGGLQSGLDDVFSSLLVYYPASFPNKASTKFVSGPLTMKCPTYTISSTKNSIRVDGLIDKTIKLITPPFRDGEVDSEVPKRRFVLAFSSDYIYPNIYQDYFQQRLSLEINSGKLNLKYDGETYQSLFDDLVLGAKVNGGPLQPVFFQNKVTQVKHDGNDKIEFFLKGESAAFDYVSVDLGKNIIQMKNGVPFPSK